jgi:hypothetical protein
MPLQGSQKIAVLLCKFTDTANVESNPISFYKDLFIKRGTGGLNDYWVAASLGAINLDGSQVFDWKTLETTRAAFLNSHPGRWDKVQGAIDAFQVDQTKYAAVVAIFNANMTDGGGAPPGVLAQPGDVNVTFLAHETGHIFGLEHSFDHSTRRAVSWSAVGEYFDRQDIMSAMNVNSDTGHRFSPRGPLLNVANLDRMGWLPAARVWHPMKNSSETYEIDIVALEHPEVPGYLAAQTGIGILAEFRMRDSFDGGLARPAVLFHEPANPNSYIIASDVANNNHEWLPGQVWGTSPPLYSRLGGMRITIVSFDLQKKTARLRVQVKATRPPFIGPEELFGLGIGRLARHGAILVLQNGKIIPIPIPEPEPILTDLRATIRGHVLEILKEDLGADITGFQTGFTNDR